MRAFFEIRAKRSAAQGLCTLCAGCLLSLMLCCGPALAATDVTSSADTSWRYNRGDYNFADGLQFSFSDDRFGAVPIDSFSPGISTASPSQTFNALGRLDISMVNGTANNSIGAYIFRRGVNGAQHSFFVTGNELHLAGEYSKNSNKVQLVSGLYMDGSSKYDPLKASGAYAQFDNTATHLSAIVNPSSLTFGYYGGAELDHGAEAIFNGNTYLDLALGANASGGGKVLGSRASHVEFHGGETILTGSSASNAYDYFYGAYVHGFYDGTYLYARQTNLLFNGERATIDVTSTGNSSVHGIRALNDFVKVTDKVKQFNVTANGAGSSDDPYREVVGISSWSHATVDIQAENTSISTSATTPISSFSNNALLSWANGNINIGGKNAIISSSGVSNGGVALYSFGQPCDTPLAQGVTGNAGTDITINADNIAITSSTTGTGEAIASYAYLNGTIHVNSDAAGADLGKTVNVTGNMYASVGGKSFFNFGNTASQFTGRARYWPEANDGSEVNVGLTNGARWNVTGNSWVTNFTAGDGHAYLGTEAGNFATLTHDTNTFTPVRLYMHNLKGTNGNFYLRADIDNDLADTLYIQNGAGSHKLFVRSHGAEPRADAMNQYLAHQEMGSAAFSLGNPGGLVDAGLYVYELAQRNVTPDTAGLTTDATEWYLKRATTPTPPDPTPDPQPVTPSKPVLSPAGEAEAALSGIAGNYALWYGQQTDLRKRLGEVRYGTQAGLWARGFVDRARLEGFSDTSFTQNTYGGSIGYDALAFESESNMWLLGIQLRAAHADQHVEGHWGGSGDLTSLGVALYSTWAHVDGWYADAVASYDHYNHKIRATMLDGTPVSDDRSSYGLGASLEVGRKFNFAYSDDKRDYWFVEPQLQLSYFWLKGGNFTASNGMEIEQNNADSLTGRAGVVLGRKFALGSGPDDPRYVQPYIKGGVNHEFLGEQVVHINNTRMDSDLTGTRVYYGAGIDWQATENLRVYAQVEREHGEHFTREFNVSVGLKWEF